MVVKSCKYNFGTVRVGVIAASPPYVLAQATGGLTNLPSCDFVGGHNNGTSGPLVPSRIEQVLEQVDLLRDRDVNIIILLDREGRYDSDAEVASPCGSLSFCQLVEFEFWG